MPISSDRAEWIIREHVKKLQEFNTSAEQLLASIQGAQKHLDEKLAGLIEETTKAFALVDCQVAALAERIERLEHKAQ